MSDVEKIIAEAHEELQEFVAVALAAHDGVINVPRGGKYWQAADRLASALRAAGYEVAKAEWEYAVYHVKVDGWGDFQHHKSLEDAESDFETCGMNCTVVRRRKAGVWQPVEGEV